MGKKVKYILAKRKIMERKVTMNSVKRKVKSITINKLSQTQRCRNEIYSALKILLSKNYKKYDLETSIDENDIKYMTDENFQSSLFKINEKSKKQKNNGVYYTSDDVARYIICNSLLMKVETDLNQTHNDENCIEFLRNLNKREKNNILYKYTIFDPTCGTGEFLINAINIKLEILKNEEMTDEIIFKIVKTIYGNDIDDESIDICKLRIFFSLIDKLQNQKSYIKLAEIINERFFSIDYIQKSNKIKVKFDIIVGNPPYVEYGKYKKENKCELKNNFGNVYADVLKNSIDMSNENTVLGYIIPLSYVATPRMSKIRKIIYEKAEKQFLLNFADRPDCLFTGVHQKLTILIFRLGDGNKEIYSSNYKHWYKEERKELLNGREINKIKNYDIVNYIPKVGNKIEESIYKKVYTEKENNIYDSQEENGNEIYLNMRATFWIKAFTFNPGSNEYKIFRYNNEIYYFILCLLNSSLFWLYWTIISDCWHITTKELKHFILPNELLSNRIYMELYKKLEKKLEKTKKYIGSKQTSYEYKHKLCKDIIDEIDDCIGEVYKLNKKEIEYCKNFALKYRVSEGKND